MSLSRTTKSASVKPPIAKSTGTRVLIPAPFRRREVGIVNRRLARWATGLLAFLVDDPHGHAGHAAHDLRLRGIVEMPDRLARLRVRNGNQLSPLQLAPGAEIPVAQLD